MASRRTRQRRLIASARIAFVLPIRCKPSAFIALVFFNCFARRLHVHVISIPTSPETADCSNKMRFVVCLIRVYAQTHRENGERETEACTRNMVQNSGEGGSGLQPREPAAGDRESEGEHSALCVFCLICVVVLLVLVITAERIFPAEFGPGVLTHRASRPPSLVWCHPAAPTSPRLLRR